MNTCSCESGDNGVDENFQEALSPSKDSRAQQSEPGRHQATSENRPRRMKWTKKVNKIVMKCCIKSDPFRSGCWISGNKREYVMLRSKG